MTKYRKGIQLEYQPYNYTYSIYVEKTHPYERQKIKIIARRDGLDTTYNTERYEVIYYKRF